MEYIMKCPSDKMIEKFCVILDKNSHTVFKPSPEQIRYYWNEPDLKYHVKSINYE